MTKKCTLILLLTASLALSACRKNSENIPPEIPEITITENAAPIPQTEERLDQDGVIKISADKIYGAPLPALCTKSYADEALQSFICPVYENEWLSFLKKYFPYQKITHYSRINIITLELTDENDEVVPNLGGVIEKPLPGKSVKIDAQWDADKLAFVVIYYNPDFDMPPPPSAEEGLEPDPDTPDGNHADRIQPASQEL